MVSNKCTSSQLTNTRSSSVLSFRCVRGNDSKWKRGPGRFIHVAKHSFVSQMTKCKESLEKKNLDGSSNPDGLKMKGCSSIQCLNKRFLLLNHLNIFAFLAFLEALLALIPYPTPVPSVPTATGGKPPPTALSGQQGAHCERSTEPPALILPPSPCFPPFLKQILPPCTQGRPASVQNIVQKFKGTKLTSPSCI